MYDTIVVPLDGSVWGETALPYAIEIAKKSGSQVYLLHVVSGEADSTLLPSERGMMLPGETDVPDRSKEDKLTLAREYLDVIAKKVAEPGLQLFSEVMEGRPAPAIIHFAQKVGADLIVLTTHGRTGVARMVMGSVADQIVRQSGCPVLLIRVA